MIREEKFKNAVRKVVDYNYEEDEDFLESDGENHIAEYLGILEDWLNGDPLGTHFRELKKQRREEQAA
jgi:hypothetical protein